MSAKLLCSMENVTTDVIRYVRDSCQASNIAARDALYFWAGLRTAARRHNPATVQGQHDHALDILNSGLKSVTAAEGSPGVDTGR